MEVQLVVRKPFGGFKRGDLITDTVTVEKILAGPQAGYVVRVTIREG